MILELPIGHHGFNLLELMIVSAVISTLTMTAIPRYETFIAKARRSEAYAAAGSLLMTQNAFRFHSGSYTNCLREVGYWSSADTDRYRRYYTVSISTWSDTSDCGPSGNDTCDAFGFAPLKPCGRSGRMFRANDTVNKPLGYLSRSNPLMPDQSILPGASKDSYIWGFFGNISMSGNFDMIFGDHTGDLWIHESGI